MHEIFFLKISQWRLLSSDRKNSPNTTWCVYKPLSVALLYSHVLSSTTTELWVLKKKKKEKWKDFHNKAKLVESHLMANNSSITKIRISRVSCIALSAAMLIWNNIQRYLKTRKKKKEKKWLHVLTHDLTTAPQVFFCSCMKGECVCAPLMPCSTIKEAISQIKKKLGINVPTAFSQIILSN